MVHPSVKLDWSNVTATFAIFILWTLMVRRRLFREIENTRVTRRDDPDAPSPNTLILDFLSSTW